MVLSNGVLKFCSTACLRSGAALGLAAALLILEQRQQGAAHEGRGIHGTAQGKTPPGLVPIAPSCDERRCMRMQHAKTGNICAGKEANTRCYGFTDFGWPGAIGREGETRISKSTSCRQVAGRRTRDSIQPQAVSCLKDVFEAIEATRSPVIPEFA